MRNKTTAKTICECFLVWIILSQTALNCKNSSACNYQSLGAYQANLLPQHEAFNRTIENDSWLLLLLHFTDVMI